MARYDKYDPISGGFRAPLNADLPINSSTGEFGPKAVSVNTTGRVVVGTAGVSGLAGLLVKNVPVIPAGVGSPGVPGSAAVVNVYGIMGAGAGDIVDVMTSGEIVDVTGFTAGVAVYAAANGDLTATATGNTKVGWMIDATRMVVRVAA